MTKKLCVIPVMLWAGGASANTTELVFSCKVKANSVIEIEHGKVVTYSGFSGQFETGDVIEMRLSLRELDGNKDDLLFYIGDHKRDKLINVVGIYKNYLDTASSFDKSGFFALDGGGRYIKYKNNSITVNQEGHPYIVLKNYWKNEWSALYTTTLGDPIHTHTFAAECVLSTDNLDAMSKRMLHWSKEAKY